MSVTPLVACSSRLESNRVAIVADACNASPKTQMHLPRSNSPAKAEATLRAAQAFLLGNEPIDGPLIQGCSAAVARLVAARLCAPRDMGAPAARALRHVLMRIAQEAPQ